MVGTSERNPESSEELFELSVIRRRHSAVCFLQSLGLHGDLWKRQQSFSPSPAAQQREQMQAGRAASISAAF